MSQTVTLNADEPVGEPVRAPDGTPLIAVDRRSEEPLYRQIAQIVQSLVSSGGLRAGDQLPGELRLCQQYGVSRTVVRQALAELEDAHVIDRRRGRGTFVAERQVAQSLVQSLHGLHEDIKAMGRSLQSEVRRLTIELADSDIAHRLRIAVGSPVVVLERLRLVDGEPWVFTVSHLPVALAPDLVTLDLREQSLYEVLQRRYGIVLTSSDRAVEACGADPALARALQITLGAPTLKLTSVSYDNGGTAVETFVAFHRADRSRFEVHLTSSREAPVSSAVRLI